MANRWLVQKLIDNAKRRGLIVTSDDPTDGFATSDFLELIDDVVRSVMVPLLKRVRESYLLREVDLALTSGRARYPLPERAAAEALHSILWDNGDADHWPPLQRTEAGQAHGFNASDGTPYAYYMKDDGVVFVPTPAAGTTVRFLIYNRPSFVVEASAVAMVSAFNTSTKQVTLLSYDSDTEEFDDATVPSTFTSNASYDIVKGTPGFRCHAYDQSATVASNVLTFAALPDDLAVGDFVALAGETPIAQIPLELHPMLAQEVTRTLLESKGDAKADRAERTVARLEKAATEMLSPRVSAGAKFIHNYNAPGWSRSRLRWRGWR